MGRETDIQTGRQASNRQLSERLECRQNAGTVMYGRQQTEGKTYRQASWHADRQADKQTNGKQAGKQVGRHAADRKVGR
jgi:hypothetical protein